MNNDDLIKRLRKARGFSKHRKMCQEAANVIEYLEIEAKDLEFTCFVGDPHKVTECPYVDRLADLEAENEKLRQSKEELRRNFANAVRDLREAIDIAKTGVSRGGTNNA